MHTQASLDSVRHSQRLGAPLDEPSLCSGGDSREFPQSSKASSPFLQNDFLDRRLNLSETANELSPCPEEVKLDFPERNLPGLKTVSRCFTLGLCKSLLLIEDLTRLCVRLCCASGAVLRDNGSPSIVENVDPTVTWGAATSQGQRMTMEDAHMGVPVLELPESCPHYQHSSFFGVFDGHGGAEAANFARDNLLNLVLRNTSFASQPGLAMNSAFIELDESFYRAVQHESPPHCSGSTVLAALLQGSQLHIANAGDSRAVISKRGRAEELSRDHRPGLSSEYQRIVQMGGFVSDGYLNGHLSVTRGIGDFHLDSLKEKKREGDPFSGPLTAVPEIQIRTLSPEDEFLVLACDGLWDVWHNSQRVVEVARQCLQQNNNDPQACAEYLVEQSIERHVSDNVTVLVICLTPDAPPRRVCGDLKRSVSQNGFKSLRSALREAAE